MHIKFDYRIISTDFFSPIKLISKSKLCPLLPKLSHIPTSKTLSDDFDTQCLFFVEK